jgi:hypothetical protein
MHDALLGHVGTASGVAWRDTGVPRKQRGPVVAFLLAPVVVRDKHVQRQCVIYGSQVER